MLIIIALPQLSHTRKDCQSVSVCLFVEAMFALLPRILSVLYFSSPYRIVVGEMNQRHGKLV